MKIQDFDKVLKDIKEKGNKVDNKDDWWAGKTSNNKFGNDLFLGHPKVGLYQLKTYNKNPLQQKGIGAKLTNKIDDGIEENFEKNTESIFGVLPNKIKKSRKRRTEKLIKNKEFNDPKNFFKNLLKALGINIRGNMTHSKRREPQPIRNLKGTFETEQKELTEEFKKILEEDQVYNSYI